MGKKERHSNTGRYQRSIYIWTSIFFIVAQILFSGVILVKTYQQEVQANYEMNEQIFRQVAYNVEQSDDVIRGLSKSLLINPKIYRMIYGIMGDEDIDTWIRDFRSVCNPILFSNPKVHSIYLYNRGMDQLFSSHRHLFFQDEEIRARLDAGESMPVLTPFVRVVGDPSSETNTTRVLTYVLYETLDSSGKPDGAIIINVDFDMFVDEIGQLITFSEEEKSEVFIFSQENEILNREEGNENPEVEAQVQKMIEEMQNTEAPQEAFLLKTRRIAGEDYGIFFTRVPSLDWTIVKVQSYREVFSNVYDQIIMITAISGIFSVLMLLSIYFLARKIYSPIGQLVQKVRGSGAEENADEIQYLNRVYENLFQKTREVQKNYSKDKIMRTYNLRSLLMDGKKTEPAVWEALQSMDSELFQKENAFGVCVLQIDNYRSLQERCNREEQELYKFVIENIFTEILGDHGYRSAIIPLEKDKMAVLVHGSPSGEEEYRRDMEGCFRSTNENLEKFVQISFSIAVSPYRKGMEEIHESFQLAEDKLPYRYVLGKASLVFYDYEAEQADDRETDETMLRLKGHIQEGLKEKIAEDFAKLTELAGRQDSSRVTEFITSQAIYILHMIESKEKAARASRGSVILERYTEILSMENWKEMSQCLQKMLMDVLSPEDGQSQKANLLVGTIRKMIQEEYADPNLCLQQISDMVKMSGQYVGRVFKGTVGLSVAEYINEYRMEKSVEIMMKTGCTVNEVLEKVGIESESQYYRLFKKKYGTTPRAYMLEKRVAGEER